MKNLKLLVIFFAVLTFFAANNANAIPHCQPCPYSCADLGLGHKDCSQASVAGGVCCVDLSNKGLAIAQAREKVTGGGGAGGACPAGFHPSSSKCSPQDRKNGCKDLRGPSGQTCISGRSW